ncbi:MAG: hypothetical protein ACJ8AJ_08625 [Gemmatimonadaceae bacterium]
MMMRLVVALVVLFGCTATPRDPGGSVYGDRSAESLVGAWDARLSLTQPYQLTMQQPSARRICGTIGFVENHRDTGSTADSMRDLGVYDLDLSRLGLAWLADGSYPTAIATASHPGHGLAHQQSSDSVTIVLNPGGRERILLVGRHDVGGITGEWVAQSARGTASGSFSLRPHSSAGEARRSC